MGLTYVILPSEIFDNGQIRKFSVTTNRIPRIKQLTIQTFSDKVSLTTQNMDRTSVRDTVTANNSQVTYRAFTSPNTHTDGLDDAERNQTLLSENEIKSDSNNNESTTNKSRLWEEQLRRRHIMNEVCQSYNISETFTPDKDFTFRMLVNDKFKFVFTYIPKVGCTTWKSILRHKGAVHNDIGRLNRLSKYTDKEREKILRSYKKVMFVRDPLVRLLSAYLSKFRVRGHIRQVWDSKFGKDIIRLYRNSSKSVMMQRASQPRATSPDIRLDEFVQYILELGNTTEMTGLTDHWLPQSVVSHVCHVRYDFIGKHEHLDSEAPFLLQWLGTHLKFPKVHQSKSESLLKMEYSKVSRELILKLPEYYCKDYELFGYDPKEILAKIT